MDVWIELLANDVWTTDDDKTGFFSVEVNSFDQLFLKERTIPLPMVQINTIKQKYDKCGEVRKLNKSKYEIFDEWSKYYVWFYPPYGKTQKIENIKQLILMNDHFYRHLSTKGIYS